MSVITDIIGDIPTYQDWRQVGGYNLVDNQYKALISRRDDGIGTPPELLDLEGYSTSPVSISTGFSDKNIFDPVAGSKATMRIYAESFSQLLLIARADDTKYRVVVSEGAQVQFRGYIRPETYRQEYDMNRPVVTFEATDGIGLLRNVEFMGELEDYSDVAGKQKVSEVIGYLLWKAGNISDWFDRINYSLPGHLSDNLLRHMEIPLWKYHEWKCYDVLMDIMSIFNMQLVQICGHFHVRLADQPYGEKVYLYNYKGVCQTNVGLQANEPVDMYAKFKGLQGDIRMERPVRSIQFEAPQTAISELIFNGDLDSAQGWSGWGGIADEMWRVEDNEMLLDFDVNIDDPYYGVQTDISRGVIPGAAIRIALSFDARIDGQGGQLIQLFVSINSGAAIPANITSNQYQRREITLVIPAGATEAFVRFRTPSVGRLRVKKISAYPLLANLNQVEDISHDTEETINSKSQQDVTYKIAYSRGGNPYRFENTFPGLSGEFSHIHDRDTGLSNTPNAFQQARAIAFYKDVKMRVSLDMYKVDDALRIDNVLYDKMYKRAYVITSLSYDMAKAMYSVEALEHERMSIEEEDEWILATGFWNDDGFWMDDKTWIDSL